MNPTKEAATAPWAAAASAADVDAAAAGGTFAEGCRIVLRKRLDTEFGLKHENDRYNRAKADGGSGTHGVVVENGVTV